VIDTARASAEVVWGNRNAEARALWSLAARLLSLLNTRDRCSEGVGPAPVSSFPSGSRAQASLRRDQNARLAYQSLGNQVELLVCYQGREANIERHEGFTSVVSAFSSWSSRSRDRG
jgi:hypothetical protein